MAEDHRIKYNWIKGVEALEEYAPGGYHPVMVGDMLKDRYHIVDKLGFGGYSTVWLAQDTYLKRYIAVKINTADSPSRETKVLKALSAPLPPSSPIHPGRDLLPSSFDDLSIAQLYQQYGEPETVPVTRRDGESLSPNIPAKAVVPLFLGKYAEKFSLSDAQPLLSDFGEAFSPTLEVRLGQDCHTPPAFRAPEAKFEPQAPLTYPSDIWSLATTIWEIIGMKAIFSTDFVHGDEIVSQHIDVLGPMPSEWWQRWEGRPRFFDEQGCPTESYQENRWPSLEDSFEIGVQKWRRKLGGAVDENEKAAFLDLMRRMLSFRPEERPTVDEVLTSEWMVKWAFPDYERSQRCSLRNG
ncbi:hypothetical protein N7497_002906 [Penicillium chrysogenum]|nr:hypothetical protein N7497_002906 [Penicillium chrysogenum]